MTPKCFNSFRTDDIYPKRTHHLGCGKDSPCGVSRPKTPGTPFAKQENSSENWRVDSAKPMTCLHGRTGLVYEVGPTQGKKGVRGRTLFSGRCRWALAFSGWSGVGATSFSFLRQVSPHLCDSSRSDPRTWPKLAPWDALIPATS